jgi:hypothetical protein
MKSYIVTVDFEVLAEDALEAEDSVAADIVQRGDNVYSIVEVKELNG